jgi:hypothetical protein
MKLFRLKQERKSLPGVPNNPFSDRKELGKEIIELDLEAEPEALSDPDAYFRAVSTAAQRFRWFGEFHIAPSRGIDYELRRKTIPALRRVLIAYLGGRPMPSVANRVRTSRRTVYKVIHRVIYHSFSDLDTWSELGLIRIWDLPEVEFRVTQLQNYIWFPEDHAAVICLLCHRLIGHIVLEERLYNSSLIEGNDRRIQYVSRENQRIRGHLIAHFHLDGRPWPNERWETPLGLVSRNPGKWIANRWIDQVDPLATGTANNHRRLLTPVIEGGSPSGDEVREYYRNLL